MLNDENREVVQCDVEWFNHDDVMAVQCDRRVLRPRKMDFFAVAFVDIARILYMMRWKKKILKMSPKKRKVIIFSIFLYFSSITLSRFNQH